MKSKFTLPAPTPSRYSLAFAAAAAGLLPVGAAPVTVPNANFDGRTANFLADGASAFADRDSSDLWRQWQQTTNGGPVRIWNPGAPGVPTEGFGGVAPSGDYVMQVGSLYNNGLTKVPANTDGVNIFEAGTQLLTETFDPTKTYKLTVKVGNRPVTGVSNPVGTTWQGYAVQLAVGGTPGTGTGRYALGVDGGTVVAQDANTLPVTVDQFGTASVTYVPNPADSALAGQPLQIRLCALDNPADLNMVGYAIFDSVTLDAFASPSLAYWDLNDTAAGAGVASPTGVWDAAGLFWNTVADGTGTATQWNPGQTAAFSAGDDATGDYTVTVDGTQSIGGLAFKNGNVTLTGGTALQLAGSSMADVASGSTATIATPFTESAADTALAKTGAGTLVLSGTGDYTGGTSVLDGTLRLGASNVLNDAGKVTVSGRTAGTTTLDLNGNSDTIGGLVLGGTAATTAAAVSTGAGTLTLGGDVSFVNASGNGGNPLGATISGNLNLGASPRTFLVNDSATASGDLSISANITGSVAMTKLGKGTLVLSGNNADATGGLTLAEGVTQFESAAAINGTARDVTVTTPGVLRFSTSFGAGNIPTVLPGRIATTSNGIIAADNFESTNFDFNTSGLTAAFLGAVSDLAYTGTLTPNGNTYRIGGGGGTLTLPENALTGSGKSVVIGGKVTLPFANDYDGGTTLNGGITFPGGPVLLTVGDNGALGSGPLTFAGGTIQSADASARTFANPVVINSSLNIGGTGNFTFTDTTPINLSVDRLFVLGAPVTTFAQGFTGTGGFTMDYTGGGNLVITGNNSYAGITLVNGGTLTLTGNNTTTGVVNLSSRFGVPVGIVLGHDNALGTSTLQISTAGATIQALGTRTLTNSISANQNFTIVGTDALTLSGTMTVSTNRTITNNNITATTSFGNIDAVIGFNYNLIFAGNGNTTVGGNISTGSGTLTKNGSGTLILSGNNIYTGLTTVADGVLTLTGDNSAASGGVTLTAGRLNLNSVTSAGTGRVTLTTGTLDNTSGSAKTLSPNNLVTFGGNVAFSTVAGTAANNLTFGTGAITNDGNRTITLNGTGTTLTFGGIMTNTSNAIQTTTIDGAGNTLVLGGYALSNNSTSRINIITGTGDVTITGEVTNGGTATASGLTYSGTGTLTLKGINTYAGATAVNSGAALSLVGGSQNSAISVADGAFLGFTLGLPTTSTKNLELTAGSKIRIAGNPTLPSYTLFTTSGTISGAPVLEIESDDYELVVENNNTLVLKSLSTPFQNWALLKGLDGTTGKENGPNDDPDNDGRTNLQEFGFDGDPLSPANDGKMVGKLATLLDANTVFTLTLPVRNGATFSGAGEQVSAAIDGVIYRIQGSDDLTDFTTMAISEITGEDATAIQSGLPSLSSGWTYRSFRSPGGITEPDPQDFLRAGVVAAP